MKKSVFSILTFCFVFMGVLAFSVPVRAASSSVSLPAFSTSVDFDVVVSGNYTVLGFYDSSNTYRTYSFYDSNTAFFSIPLTFKLPVYSLAGTNVYPTSDLCYFRSVASFSVTKATASNAGLRSYSIRNGSCHFLDSSFPIEDGSGSVRFSVDVSDYYYNRFPLNDAVFYTCDFVGTLASQSEDTSCSFTVSLSVGSDNSYWATTFEFWDSDRLGASDIQKQTDTMTNGYDNSSMSSDNTRLNNQIAQYDQAQEETMNSSKNYIDAAQFINPFDNATLLSSVTFCTSFLQSLFMNIGNWQIIVTVSLCITLALMLVGWFRFKGK